MPNAQVDAPVAPNLESYTDNGDGTVTDNVTALVWQQSVPSTQYTQPEAAMYCAGLNLGGYTDWRLPSVIELLSIVDRSTYAPSINAAAFPNTPSQWFWSSTPYAGAVIPVWWGVFFIYGNPTSSASELAADYVRCVR